MGLSSGVRGSQSMMGNWHLKVLRIKKSLSISLMPTKKKKSLNRINAEMQRALRHGQLLSPLRPTTKPSQCWSLSILNCPLSIFVTSLQSSGCPGTRLRATSSYFAPVYNLHSDARVDKWADSIYWRGNDRRSVKICAWSQSVSSVRRLVKATNCRIFLNDAQTVNNRANLGWVFLNGPFKKFCLKEGWQDASLLTIFISVFKNQALKGTLKGSKLLLVFKWEKEI